MKFLMIAPSELHLSQDLNRSGSAKQFEERLKSSIEEIGIAEPIKVAPLPSGGYVVIDGIMRLRAVNAIRSAQPNRFDSIPAYVFDYERRFEIRYQSDIYQDLLPSQLAMLVEHLHKAEHIRKIDIARFIGVSPATLRNYTGLWRLLQRGDLFAMIVDLMDVEVIPSSNPYAWLRLTPAGLRKVVEDYFADGEGAESWIKHMVERTRDGDKQRYPIKFVEDVTNALAPEYYRVAEEVRSAKRNIGQLKGAGATKSKTSDSEKIVRGDASQRHPEIRKSINNSTHKPGTGSTSPDRMDQIDLRKDVGAKQSGGINSSDIDSLTESFSQLDLWPADDKPMAHPVSTGLRDAFKHLDGISRRSPDPVLRVAADSLLKYLQ